MEELSSLLGKKAKDKVTGLTGTVTGVAMYLYGNPLLCIAFSESREGKDIWCELARIEVLD